MADPWELILHHTYAGTPGVIFDQSPGRGSHGVTVDIADTDFLTDGISPGSGAVKFGTGSRIRVRATRNWSQLSGLRGEIVCLLDEPAGINALLDTDTFRFYVRTGHLGAWFSAYPHQYAQIDHHSDGFDQGFTVPAGQWMTLGFLHDGVSTMELHYNGATIARITKPLWPVNPTNSVTIGTASGRIDDVKVWRINPHRVGDEFTDRPVDPDVSRCWAEWARATGEMLAANRDCAERVRDLLMRAVQSMIRDGLTHGSETRERWEQASLRYRQHWRAGELGDIAPVIADLLAWLRLAGLDPAEDPDVAALLNDPCLTTILQHAPPLDCDPDFVGLLRDAASNPSRKA